MTNLFIVHTQYNLILASGLSSREFADDRNELVIFHDFQVREELLTRLGEVFDRVTVLEGNIPKREMSASQKLSYLRACNAKLKAFMDKPYDRIFVVDDMCIPEMYALKRGYKKNRKVEMAWLEDGSNAYFYNGVVSGGMGGTPLKRLVRKCFFGIGFGLGSFYDLSVCMGTHKRLTGAYVTFPEQIRGEFSGREVIGISQESFESGMRVMYGGEPVVFEENSLLIAMDKLDVYGESLDEVNGLIAGIVADAAAQGRRVYYKYHPRESEKLPALAEQTELDRSIGLESYLTRSSTNGLTVVGIKSTALQTAKKMGFPTVSLIARVGEADAAVLSFYQKIGVMCADETYHI